jgi:SAM-dependent methyltransferase
MTRLKVLNACSLVEHVHLATHGLIPVLEQLRPVAYVKGQDWLHTMPDSQIAACHRLGIPLVFIGPPTQSSSKLLGNYEKRRNAEKLAAFEQFVQSQKPADTPWEPVTDYSYEARQAIEGPHAQIIKDTFSPTLTLDVGCGPGHLVRMLMDAGVTAFGMDTNDTADYQYDVAGDGEWMYRADLVICREVLEHLTVRQLATAVRNLVKLSSKYVYVTTRFTPQSHLLDVDGADELDPTHITMLNQDYLRSLFVLEGCRRRADLEQKLDWMKKGRVLVYEVPA